MSTIARRVALDLLDIGAVVLRPAEPFTWSSGLRAPIYCDNRLTLSHVDVRNRIADSLSQAIQHHRPEVDVLVGTATAGIPHAALAADRLQLPLAYVRGERKAHGTRSRIEGDIQPGSTAIVIEDLVSTGGSALSAVRALREAGVSTTDVFALYTYELDVARKAFEEHDVQLHALATFSDLLKAALSTGSISEEDARQLDRWQHDPRSWSENACTIVK